MPYLEDNRNALLSIFGQIRAGRGLELLVNNRLTEEELDRSCCENTIVIHKYASGEVDFPIRHSTKKIDQELAEELYAIVLCEEAVREGILIRDGDRYCPADKMQIQDPAKFGKYLVAEK